jgi:nucleoid-associated protein YejK
VGDEKYIIKQMETYIRQGGGRYGDWFIGLADNPIAPIMEVSRLRKMQNHRFAYVETMSGEVAKAVADYFIDACGVDGNISAREGNGVCRALYLYKKAEHLVACETGISSRSTCWVRNKLFRVCAPDNNKVIGRLYAPRP